MSLGQLRLHDPVSNQPDQKAGSCYLGWGSGYLGDVWLFEVGDVIHAKLCSTTESDPQIVLLSAKKKLVV